MMTFEEIMKEIERNKKCYIEQVYQILSKKLNRNSDMEDYQEEEDNSVITLAKSMCADGVQFIGPVEAIHNVSVEYARCGYYDYACAVLQKGLDIDKYAKNIDLLADFLKYSISSSTKDSNLAENYFTRLSLISKQRWNWRAFGFSIDYLLSFLDNCDKEENDIKDVLRRCLQLASEYTKRLGDSSDGDKAYHALANVYEKKGDAKKCKEILQSALSKLKRAPMCALQLTEIFFNDGMYDEAKKYINKCILMNIDVDNSINMGYPYILSALCRIMSAYERREDIANKQESEKEIKLIKRDYESAKSILGEDEKRVRNLKSQIAILEKQLDIQNENELYEIE